MRGELEDKLEQDLRDACNYIECVMEEFENKEMDEETKHNLMHETIIKDYLECVLGITYVSMKQELIQKKFLTTKIK